MPELPEVETIARGVDQSLRGDRILDTWFSDKREPFKSSPQAMAEMLPGRRI
jgi:formamidopyrimidine-DNA glycosylase